MSRLRRRRWLSSGWALITSVFLLINAAAGLVLAAPALHGDNPGEAALFEKDLTSIVETDLLRDLSTSGTAGFWVSFNERPDLKTAPSMDWSSRGKFVYTRLRETADRSQARTKDFLTSLGVEHESYWILNTIFVPDGDLQLVSALASLPEVSEIKADRLVPLIEPEPETEPYEGRINNVEWGIADIRADEVWEDFEIKGTGIVIGSIDTGVMFDHPALINQYRGNKGDGTFDHNYSWHDPTGMCGSTPCDNNGHGTHTVGTMVGDDGRDNKIGVAPGAQWIAAKGCEGDGCSTAALLSSMQFMLAPTDLNGDNPDTDKRPHIVNNSWGGSVPNTDYQQAVQHWIAAGIFPVFANGNSGPACGTVGSPALFPEAYGVGNYTSAHVIANLSSRGPGQNPYNTIKPNISAPGTSVRSSLPGGGYGQASGTSMAAPHVAGAIALLWSGSDLLGDIDGTREILDRTAIPVNDLTCGGEPEFNNVWGHGRLDAYAAVEAAAASGLLEGIVTEADGSFSIAGETPIEGVTVTATNQKTGLRRETVTDADGNYALDLPTGVYDVQFSKFGYDTKTETDVEVETEQTTELSVVLEPSATATVSGVVTSKEDGEPLAAVVTVFGTPVDPVETDPATGAYEVTLPLGEYTLRVQAGGRFPGAAEVDLHDDITVHFPLEVFDVSVLLVDDQNNHSHDASAIYEEALQELGVNYDLFTVRSGSNGPDADEMAPWDVIVWFSGGTTWGAGPSAADEGALETYLENGGSLFLSSQEYLRQRNKNPFNEQYLGLDGFTRDSGSTFITGVGDHPVGRYYPDPLILDFPSGFSNLSDTVVAAKHAETAFTGNIAAPGIALTVDGLHYKTAFLAFPWEVIEDDAARFDLMRDFLAWLADKPDTGFVVGTVTDHNDGKAIAGATVRAIADGEIVRHTTTDDEGNYRLQVPLGTYTIEASARHYEPAAEEAVTLEEEGEEAAADFSLETGRASADRDAFEFTLMEGSSGSDTFVLGNEGTVSMEWEIRALTFRPQTTSSQNIRLARDPDYDVLSPTAEGLYGDLRPEYAPAEPGNVLKSWQTGLAIPWGVGYDGDVIISNPAAGGGDDHNHRFTVEGDFISKWSTSPWKGSWIADMSYDENHDLIWQVNVGGNNCLYGMNPDDGAVVGTICGSPWTDSAQRGVAHRADNDTFYVGGWVDNIIYHIKGFSHDNPGEVIEQYPYSPGGRGLAGMTWNGDAEVLWVATNSEDDNVYALKPDEGWEEVAVIGHPEGGEFKGGGLSIDEYGDLWMISQGSRMAYLVESGIHAYPRDSWLMASPERGELNPGGDETITVSVDTDGLDPGVYTGAVGIASNSGRGPIVAIPVTMTVLIDGAGRVKGEVTDQNDGLPVAGATVKAFGEEGEFVDETVTDDDGQFEMELRIGTYTLEASAENYGTDIDSVEIQEDGGVHTVNFTLPTAQGEADPDELEFTLQEGQSETKSFTLSNSGTREMTYSIRRRRVASVSASASDGSSGFGGGLQRDASSDVNAVTTEGVNAGGSPAAPPSEPGDVLISWSPGLAVPWGVGFHDGVILSDPSFGGGDDHNHKFTVEGEFITKWSTAAWQGGWAADMAYDDTHHLIWQVNVGGDNCLYGLDPEDGTPLEKICGSPWTDMSQLGVAYRSDNDTLYVGGWDEDIIYHIKGLSHDNPGEVIEQYEDFAPGSIAGMAWNDTAKVLWVATNTADDNVYALSPDDGWAQVAVIGHPEGGGYTAGGLSMDDEGNLWMVSWQTGTAYLVYSGIPHAGSLGWLDVDPMDGTVPAGESVTIDVTVDTEDLGLGIYEAEIILDTDSGREPKVLTVAVTMHVVEPGYGPELTITEPAEGMHTNDDTITVAGTAIDPDGGEVTVTVNGEEAEVHPDGSFEIRILLPEEDGPFGIEVVATGDGGDTATETRTIIVDRTAPDITAVMPEEDVELVWGEELTISFTSEPGLRASYQVLVGTNDELPGVAMDEVEPGVYQGTYTAPHGAAFTGAEIEVYAVDEAGNMARATADGKLSVVSDEAEAPVIVITEPTDGFLTNRDAVRVSGTATADQGIDKVTVNGREADVDADGSFTTRVILWEGDNTITVVATATDGAAATETVTITADWTAPVLTDLEPAADITLEWGETYTFRFKSEPGLNAAYQIVVGGSHGTFITRDIPIKGTAMTEVQDGVYEAVYTAPEGVLLENAIVQFNAADPADNVIMTTATGELTVVETK